MIAAVVIGTGLVMALPHSGADVSPRPAHTRNSVVKLWSQNVYHSQQATDSVLSDDAGDSLLKCYKEAESEACLRAAGL